MDSSARPEKSPQERLVSAVLAGWELGGDASVSARQISGDAGVPVSSIYHHFGSMEQLSAAAQDDARREAEAWFVQQRAQFKGLSAGPETFSSLAAIVIQDWSWGQRRLAFAWREGQRQAARDETARAGVQRWRRLWEDFWFDICGQFDLAPYARLTARLFERESLYQMAPWRPVVDRAALHEFCGLWTACISGLPLPAAPWRDYAREETAHALDPLPDPDETSLRIAESAADLLGAKGVGELTHRAVASQCGLTLGVVSHKFRTRADLVRSAFQVVYRRSSAPVRQGQIPIPTDNPPKAFEGLLELIGSFQDQGLEELLIAAARDPQIAPIANQLHYKRGDTSKYILQALIGKTPSVPEEAVLMFGNVVGGEIRAHLEKPGVETMREAREDIELLMTRLAPT